MTDSNFQSQLNALKRQIFRTRVGGIVGLLGLGVSMGFGVHHLGSKHHETFKDFYDKHKKKPIVTKHCPIPPPPLLLTDKSKNQQMVFGEDGPMAYTSTPISNAEIEQRKQSVLKEAAQYNVPAQSVIFKENGSVKYIKHPHWMPGKPIRAAWKYNADTEEMETVDPNE
jgi:hypothetical protein